MKISQLAHAGISMVVIVYKEIRVRPRGRGERLRFGRRLTITWLATNAKFMEQKAFFG